MPFVTTEDLDAEARKTLDLLFAQHKTSVSLYHVYVDFGVMQAELYVPWLDGKGQFVLQMNARDHPYRQVDVDRPLDEVLYIHPYHQVEYIVPPSGPFAVVAPPLADAIAVELVVALLQKMHQHRTVSAFHDDQMEGEYKATFLPLVKSATDLCRRGRTSDARRAARVANVLDHAVAASAYTCATEEERGALTLLAAQARKQKCLCAVAFAVHVGVKLLRWKARCMERMYAPDGLGYELAQRSYAARLM